MQKNDLIRKIRLTSNFMTSQPGKQTIAMHILFQYNSYNSSLYIRDHQTFAGLTSHHAHTIKNMHIPWEWDNA